MPPGKKKETEEQDIHPLLDRAERLAKKLNRPAIAESARRMGDGGSGGFFRLRPAVFGGIVAFLFLLCREAWRAHIQGVLSPEPVVDNGGVKPRAVGSQHAGLRFVADLRAGTSLSTLGFEKRSDGPCTPLLCSRGHVVRRVSLTC